jgi:flagellar protein FlaI
MSGLTKDNDSEEDVNSLLKMIGGIKKMEEERKNEDTNKNNPPSPPAAAEPSEAGDFSALIKKLGMTKKDEETQATGPSPRQGPAVPAAAIPADDFLFSDEDPAQNLPVSPPVKKEESRYGTAEKEAETGQKSDGYGKDVRGSLGKLLGNKESPRETQPSASPPVPAPASPRSQKSRAQPEPADDFPIEIVDEDPKAALRRAVAGGKAPMPDMPPSVKINETDEKIITVDQIADFTGLILPKGATFKIDELRLHGRINSFEGTGSGTLPPELNEIWKREFSTAGFKDLDIDDELGTAAVKAKPEAKKFGLSSLFKAILTETVEYDPKIHGPLVDLTFTPTPGLEEMEMYPVNEPFAYIRITYDHSTHEYTYHVLEPILTDPEKDLLKELKERLFETLDINTKDISKEEAKRQLRVATDNIMRDFGIKLTPPQREKVLYNMHKDFLGEGLIDPIMHDKYIEDISCDGVHTPLFAFHSSYESMKTTLAYHNAEDLDSFVTKLAQRSGKYISIAEPILDATMQDGSRIQMTLGQEVTAHGSTFTIRKFKDEPITPTDLIEWHTFAPLSIAYIWLCVENGKSAIFAGGTASGKTTALNAISLFIPPMAKIVSLEDTREVKLPHPNWIPSVTRDSFDTAGRGEINMYELLRAAMRQRPEYIIVGEVRGKECQTLFQAMSTGHVTYSTTHADSVASVVHRIENPPMDVPRNMLSALDFICIQVQARVGGKRIRRNKQIVEILDIDPRTNELITNEVFKWRSATDEHNYSGKSYLLEEIMEAKGWSENRMREELKRRQEVLEWMRIKKIRHYKDVAKILISYHRDPEAVIERVRKDLYE